MAKHYFVPFMLSTISIRTYNWS